MRKIIIKFTPNNFIKKIQGNIFEKIKSMKLLEIIKLDLEKGVKLTIMEVEMNGNYELENSIMPKGLDLIEIFQKKRRKYVCLLKHSMNKKHLRISRLFNLDVIWDRPIIVSKNKVTVSVTGEEKFLKKILTLIKLIGNIEQVSFNKGTYKNYNLISVLTSRQEEIFTVAKKQGYYEYPRKINATKLAKIVKCSTPTLIEHLRKIENKIFSLI